MSERQPESHISDIVESRKRRVTARTLMDVTAFLLVVLYALFMHIGFYGSIIQNLIAAVTAGFALVFAATSLARLSPKFIEPKHSYGIYHLLLVIFGFLNIGTGYFFSGLFDVSCGCCSLLVATITLRTTYCDCSPSCSPHPLGTQGCQFEEVPAPEPVNDMFYVEGKIVSRFTLMQRMFYRHHGGGIWSRKRQNTTDEKQANSETDTPTRIRRWIRRREFGSTHTHKNI